VSSVRSRDAINAAGYNIAINQKRWKLGEEIFINWNKKPKNLGKTEKEACQRVVKFHDTNTALITLY
jgi:formiminotetrahydrofolate cyclodeaminase